jgi:Amt family ammonium transporter
MPALNTGNNAWMLISAALVLLMTPGLAFFYGGMVRRKNVINMLMMSFSAMGTVGVVYVLWGYSMSFSGNILGGLVGNPFTSFGLAGQFPEFLGPGGAETAGNSFDGGSGVTSMAFVAFQLTFAIITVALISGSVADRMKFSSWLVLSVVWVTVTYFPLAHMVWGGGLLSADGPVGRHLIAPMDFAGGTVVHIDAGVAGVVLAYLLGRRRGYRKDRMRPHNVPFVMLGAGLLWFGWFGFNAGSAGNASGLAGLAWINTSTATSAAMIGWLAVERIRDRHATGVGAASGAVAGLVAITPAAGFVSPIGSIAIGAIAGATCAWAIGLKNRLGLDDSLDVGGVHLVGGFVGTVLIGFFSTSTGLFYGSDGRQLLAQVIAAAAAIAYSGVTTLIVGLAIKKAMGLRAATDDELEGLDVAIHGESAYDLEGASLGGSGTLSHVFGSRPPGESAPRSNAHQEVTA